MSKILQQTIDTVECRWFWLGELPRGVLEWLRAVADHELRQQAPRTDRYLRLASEAGETTGVKLREGQLEIKRLLGEMEPRPDDPAPLQRWRKHALPLAAEVSQTFGDAEQGESSVDDEVTVVKRRWISRWSLDTERDAALAAAPSLSGPRCELELAEVERDDHPQRHWTAALEASGDPDEAARALRDTFVRAWKVPGAPRLAEGCCASYAAWIAGARELRPAVLQRVVAL